MTTQANAPIKGKSTEGDFVLKGQELATSEGFKNVSKTWYDKTRPISEVHKEYSEREEASETLELSLDQAQPQVDANGEITICDVRSGRSFHPNLHAIKQIGSICRIGQSYPALLFQGGRDDKELLVDVFEHHLARLENFDQKFRFRIHDQTRLTGVVSEGSGVLGNSWYLRLLNNLVPDGRISHLKDLEDSLHCNLLIPDTMRQESDSEYGAMLSINNCDVQAFRFCQRPSLFRAICMNGCIWGQGKGNALTMSQIGRGAPCRNEAAKQIEKNLLEQIPLCHNQLDSLLSTRQMSTDQSMKPVIAQLCKTHRINKAVSTTILQSWNVEKQLVPDLAPTMFGLINGVTRAAQQLDPLEWHRLDLLGGRLLHSGSKGWEGLLSRAKRMTQKEVDKTFQTWQPQLAS